MDLHGDGSSQWRTKSMWTWVMEDACGSTVVAQVVGSSCTSSLHLPHNTLGGGTDATTTLLTDATVPPFGT
jgi:hypothetical protein